MEWGDGRPEGRGTWMGEPLLINLAETKPACSFALTEFSPEKREVGGWEKRKEKYFPFFLYPGAS